MPGVRVVQVISEYLHQSAVPRAPDPDRRIVAAAGQPLTIGAECQNDDSFLVAGESLQESAGVGTPDSYRLIELVFLSNLSSPALATRCPSGLKATVHTVSAGPVKVRASDPSRTRQIRTAQS